MTKETLSAVHQMLREDLSEQLRNADNIDTKISIVAGFNALLFVLTLQIYPHVNTILFSMGLSLLIVSLFLLFKAYRTQNWHLSPNPQAVIRDLNEGKEIEDIYRQSVGNLGGVPQTEGADMHGENLGAIWLNEKQIDRKARLFDICTYILSLGLVLVGLSRIFS